MTLPVSPTKKNLFKGGGASYFAFLDANGDPKGLMHLGNQTTLEIQPVIEYDKHYSMLTSEFEKDISEADTIGATLSLILEEYSARNFNIAFLGDGVHEVTQGSGYEPQKAVTIDELDCWYSVGKRNISNVVVKGDGGTPTYVENTDYKVDTVKGWIYPMSSGSISEGASLEVTYNYSSWAAEEIRGLTNPTCEGYLYFDGDPRRGPMIEAEIWRVRLSTNAPVPLLTRDYGRIELTGEILSEREKHPDAPFFKAILEEQTT